MCVVKICQVSWINKGLINVYTCVYYYVSHTVSQAISVNILAKGLHTQFKEREGEGGEEGEGEGEGGMDSLIDFYFV